MISTFTFNTEIEIISLFDGRLETYGIFEIAGAKDGSQFYRCLSDGDKRVYVYGDEVLRELQCYSEPSPEKIITAVEAEFGTKHQKGSYYDPEAPLVIGKEEVEDKHFLSILPRYLDGEYDVFRERDRWLARHIKEMLDIDPTLDNPKQLLSVLRMAKDEFKAFMSCPF
jgi:hypothetical protein